MFKLIEWGIENWKVIGLVLTILVLLSLLVPITNGIRNAKQGLKEIFTPLGFLVFVGLILLAIFLYTQFKGYL